MTLEQVNSTVNNTETQETATDDAFDTVPLEEMKTLQLLQKKLSQHLQNQQSPWMLLILTTPQVKKLEKTTMMTKMMRMRMQIMKEI